MRKEKGSITIYLLLSLVLVTGLICTLTESARVGVLNAKLRDITFMAADSCFAGFARELFEEYGVMGLWEKEGEFLADFNGYIRKNLNFSDLNLYYDADLTKAEHLGSAVTEMVYLTDKNGTVFTDQVEEYMERYLVQEALSEFLSMLPFFEAGNKLSEFVKKINEYQEIFVKVAQTIGKIQSAAEKVQSVVYNPKTLLGNMHRYAELYEQTGNSLYVGQFNLAYWNMEQGKDQMEFFLDSLCTETSNYYIYAADAKDAIDDLQNELDSGSESFTPETREAILLQLDELRQAAADTEGEYYRVKDNEETALSCLEKLEDLDSFFSSVEPEESRERISEYKETVSSWVSYFETFAPEDLGLVNSPEYVKAENPGFLSTIGSVFSEGLLRALTDGKLSDRKVDTGDFPSVSSKSFGFLDSAGSLGASSIRKLILGEYILSHFGCYTNQLEETALSYEVEYMIGGRKTDKENLERVLQRVVLLRAGLNLVSFMNDPGKLGEASAIAHGILGFTGQEALVQILKLVIINIWCLAEGLCDAKTLLAGDKVALIKDPQDWTLSSAGFRSFSKRILPAAASENGLSYPDYLRVLLLLTGTKTQAFRAMDMIQANECLRYNDSFRMKECISGAGLEVDFSAPQLFTALPFAREMAGSGRGSYLFSYTQEYAY